LPCKPQYRTSTTNEEIEKE